MSASYGAGVDEDVVGAVTSYMKDIQPTIDSLTQSYRAHEYMMALQHYDIMLACPAVEIVAEMIVSRNSNLAMLTQNDRFTFALNDLEATRQVQAAMKEAEKLVAPAEDGLDKGTVLIYHTRRQIEQAWGYALLAAVHQMPDETEHHCDIVEDYERVFECTSDYLRAMAKPSTTAKELLLRFYAAEQCISSDVVAAAMVKHVPANSTQLTELVACVQSYQTRLTLATADTIERCFVRYMKTEDCLSVFTHMLGCGFVPLSTRPFAMLFNSNNIWTEEVSKYYELMLDYGIAPELSTLRILCKQCPEQSARNHFSILISMLSEKQASSIPSQTRGSILGNYTNTSNYTGTSSYHNSGALGGETAADAQASGARSHLRHSTFFSYRLDLLARGLRQSELCISSKANSGNNNNNNDCNNNNSSSIGSDSTSPQSQGRDNNPSHYANNDSKVIAADTRKAQDRPHTHTHEGGGSMLMEAMRCIHRAEVEGSSLCNDTLVLRKILLYFCNGDTPLRDLVYPFRPLAISRPRLPAHNSDSALSGREANSAHDSNNSMNKGSNSSDCTNYNNDSNIRGIRCNGVYSSQRQRILERGIEENSSDGEEELDENDDESEPHAHRAQAATTANTNDMELLNESGSHIDAGDSSLVQHQRYQTLPGDLMEPLTGFSAAQSDEKPGTGITKHTPGLATPAEETAYVLNVLANHGILPDNRLLHCLANRFKVHECDVGVVEQTVQSMLHHNRQSKGTRAPVHCQSCVPLLNLYVRRRMRYRAIQLVRSVVMEFYEYTALFHADWGGMAVMQSPVDSTAAPPAMSVAPLGSGAGASHGRISSLISVANSRDVERMDEKNSSTFMNFIHVSMRAGPLDWTLGLLALTLVIVDTDIIPRIRSSLIHFYDSTHPRSIHREVMCALHHCEWKREKILCCDALMLEPHETQGGASPESNTQEATEAAAAFCAEKTHSDTKGSTNATMAASASATGATSIYTAAVNEPSTHTNTRGAKTAPTLLSYMNIALREMGADRTVTEWFRKRMLDARATALEHRGVHRTTR